VELGSAVSLCDLSQGLILDAGNSGSQYIWNTGASTQTIEVSEAGFYSVSVINTSNCNLTDTIEVTGDLGGAVLYTPNTFTPNGDGRNDVFFAKGTSIVEFHMEIYDRWGALLFTSDDINNCWDGKYKGATVQQDTYVAKIRYVTDCGGEVKKAIIRHVNVIR
jgi:gliding motility-associated-like protein